MYGNLISMISVKMKLLYIVLIVLVILIFFVMYLNDVSSDIIYGVGGLLSSFFFVYHIYLESKCITCGSEFRFWGYLSAFVVITYSILILARAL